MLTGRSGLRKDGNGFAFDIGAEWSGQSEFCPDYVLPTVGFQPGFARSPFVMYFPSQRIKATTGKPLGDVFDPYFNRTYRHYCSHQHAPPRPEPAGFHCGVQSGNIVYLAHPVFSIYRAYGAVAVKQYVVSVIQQLLGEQTAELTLPSTARVTLTRQPEKKRWVLHVLFANTISRGGQMRLSGGTVATSTNIEVIEELQPLRGVAGNLRLGAGISRATLEPQGTNLPIRVQYGVVLFEVPEFSCHQMIVFSED